MLFVTSLMCILSAIAFPSLTAGLDRSRARAAARYLAHQCGLARMMAVGRSAHVALRFEARRDDYELQMFVDGNRNGVRAKDIADGVDTPLGLPESLGMNFPGVRIGLSPESGAGGDPVRIGRSALLSFTPLGTATAGSIYVRGRDGTQFVVRVLGATARTRVLRFEPERDTWVEP